ncbi:hypothetical protein AMPH_13106 [Acinetobacter baumannii]|nr:hypothetical protein AMPH_13106 [Acinetobacter baumannii]
MLMTTFFSSVIVASTDLISGSFICSWLITATSRAIPRILKQSPRFGVILISMTLSSSFKYSRMFTPTGASLGNSSKPSILSSRSISEAPHSMPCDSTPRSLPFLILKSPGNIAPIVATGAFIPARTLGAPHTICKGSPEPIFTVVTRRRSASGCCSTVRTSPTTTPVNGLATGASSSTSRPSIVN